MSFEDTYISNRRLRTPRSAATAGIIFALLFGIGYVLIQISVPTNFVNEQDWVENLNFGQLGLGLSFLPFAGIAFLWYLGVIRDRLGKLEDQFFATLFLGSGLLYLGLTFASAAIAGGMLSVQALDTTRAVDLDVYLLARAISNRITGAYAVRMAGMFMTVLGTIWLRTQVMPRWIALITYSVALVLLISLPFTHWVMLLFPFWVFLTSAYILVLNYRSTAQNPDPA